MVGRLRTHQTSLLRQLREMEIFHTDGSRSMKDWTAAKLDVSHDTARALMTASKAEELLPDVSFDRAVATARLVAAGGDADTVEWSQRFDIAGVRRLVAHQRRITKVSEEDANADQRLRIYPDFEKSQYQTSGTFGPLGGRVLEQFFERLADELPHDGKLSREKRQAAALVAHAEDYLAGSLAQNKGKANPIGVINVHVDADLAGRTFGEAGAELEFGPRIGPAALEELLCSGRIRVIVNNGDGKPVLASHATRAIPAHIRAHVLRRDGGCTIDGCSSRYRLEPHHITPWAEGGSHDPKNLTTLCWYHHHVAIHQHGRVLDPDTPPQRRRFLRIRRRAPPITD